MPNLLPEFQALVDERYASVGLYDFQRENAHADTGWTLLAFLIGLDAISQEHWDHAVRLQRMADASTIAARVARGEVSFA